MIKKIQVLEHLSEAEIKALLEPFIERALTGNIATAKEIKKAFEHSIHKTTIYRILKRNGWRKIVPRPFHVEAKRDEQEEFKQNLETMLFCRAETQQISVR
ncbi:helix-turn-helix domain-containing protein [Candidatus Magnetomonas plexicatena]|uniref:helix-turn-helix domain-containing protein n=1 Tax=Candidatus Magnetomonas plexicatena TaxID=2552947 RepID=UPI001C77478F|nr:winged helix-turn-helix domain-containing protein [Nitrospirales bacterium LBB_01]